MVKVVRVTTAADNQSSELFILPGNFNGSVDARNSITETGEYFLINTFHFINHFNKDCFQAVNGLQLWLVLYIDPGISTGDILYQHFNHCEFLCFKHCLDINQLKKITSHRNASWSTCEHRN